MKALTHKITLFLSNLRSEFVRIKWPTKNEFLVSLVAVVIIGIIFILYTSILDAVFYNVIMWLFNVL